MSRNGKAFPFLVFAPVCSAFEDAARKRAFHSVLCKLGRLESTDFCRPLCTVIDCVLPLRLERALIYERNRLGFDPQSADSEEKIPAIPPLPFLDEASIDCIRME
jgi:hypothetical protein